MRAPNPSLRQVAGLIGLLVVVVAIAALLGSTTVALATLALLVGAVGVLAVVLYRRTHEAAAAARQEANRRLAAVEKSLESLVAGAGRAESERKVILRRTNALRSSILTDQQAVQQLITRFQPEAPLPLVAGWAVDPTALFWLVDHVDRARPELVVECGSGTSTLWIALALRRNGSGPRTAGAARAVGLGAGTDGTAGRRRDRARDVPVVRHRPGLARPHRPALHRRAPRGYRQARAVPRTAGPRRAARARCSGRPGRLRTRGRARGVGALACGGPAAAPLCQSWRGHPRADRRLRVSACPGPTPRPAPRGAHGRRCWARAQAAQR